MWSVSKLDLQPLALTYVHLTFTECKLTLNYFLKLKCLYSFISKITTYVHQQYRSKNKRDYFCGLQTKLTLKQNLANFLVILRVSCDLGLLLLKYDLACNYCMFIAFRLNNSIENIFFVLLYCCYNNSHFRGLITKGLHQLSKLQPV